MNINVAGTCKAEVYQNAKCLDQSNYFRIYNNH